MSLIYYKMVSLPFGDVNESSAMSIMGADVETLAETLHLLICSAWADMIQLGLAIWLLANQLGAVCVAPIIIAVSKLRPRCPEISHTAYISCF